MYLPFSPCTIMFSTFFWHICRFSSSKKCFHSDFGPSAMRLRMEESAVIFAAYDIWYGEDMQVPPIYTVGAVFILMCLSSILSSRRNSRATKKTSTAALVFYTSQQAAYLNFEPVLKRPKKQEKPNFESNFFAKKKKNQETRGKNNFWKNCWFWSSVLF